MNKHLKGAGTSLQTKLRNERLQQLLRLSGLAALVLLFQSSGFAQTAPAPKTTAGGKVFGESFSFVAFGEDGYPQTYGVSNCAAVMAPIGSAQG